jgi:mxaJ protein
VRLVAAAVLALLVAGPSAAKGNELRVCADPGYLPFSNRAGQGFENQLASFVARALGAKLVYEWDDSRGPGGYEQFIRETLNAKRCDVVMDVPYASSIVLPTRPYYISSYVFVYLKRHKYDITSMDSPALRNLRIGFESDTPAENGLKLRTLILHAVPFETGDSAQASPAAMLDALQAGEIAVGVTWEPAIGTFLRERPQFAAVAVPNSRSQGSPEQYAFPMAMAARLGDTATRDRLDKVIAAHAAELTAILERNGVKLYKPSDVGLR